MSTLVHPAAATNQDAYSGSIPWRIVIVTLSALLGALLSEIAYASMQPLLAGILAFLLGCAVLYFTPLGGLHERRIFFLVFAVGWLAAGVAALYGNVFHDPFQNESDPANFFRLASGSAAQLTLDDISVITEGSGAVLLWRLVYDTAAVLGFARDRFIGILINVLAVALTAVVAVRIAANVFGTDEWRMQRLRILFAWCGMFWLFAAIHLRDAVVLLAVSALCWVWTRYLARPSTGRYFAVVGATVAALGVFAFLRTEFLFVPFAVAGAGLAASYWRGTSGLDMRQLFGFVAVFMLFGLALVVLGERIAALWPTVQAGYQFYREFAASSASEGSLGMSLIVNQPMPVRAVVGSVYLYLFPIPFWSGFQLESVYHLFKSFHVLFIYALLPLLLLAAGTLVTERQQRRAPVMFLLMITIGFTVVVALTSLETRHLGTFLVPMLVLALLPDLRSVSVRRTYLRLLGVVLTGVALVHAAWLVLKI